MRNFILLLFTVLLFSSCNDVQKTTKINLTGEAQGTYYSISFFASNNNINKEVIDKLLSDFDNSASNYKAESIISKVNNNEDVILDDIFIGNYNMANKISIETNGDFDITVRPLVQAWGFGSISAKDMDSLIVDSIMSFVGYDKVIIKDGKIIKKDNRLQLDFDAIAQGYAVDVIKNYLLDNGISNFLVDIGGEVYASEFKEDSIHWKVGIETPTDSAKYGENLSAIVSLSKRGMATSGNYRKFYVKDGVKYSHTINPKTGYPIASRLLSATVLTSKAANADAYATAFMVMGLDKTIKFLDKHKNIDAYLIYSDKEGNYNTFVTPGVVLNN